MEDSVQFKIHAPIIRIKKKSESAAGLRPDSREGQHHPSLGEVQAFEAQNCSSAAMVTRQAGHRW